jgi:hypothetical protein
MEIFSTTAVNTDLDDEAEKDLANRQRQAAEGNLPLEINTLIKEHREKNQAQREQDEKDRQNAEARANELRKLYPGRQVIVDHNAGEQWAAELLPKGRPSLFTVLGLPREVAGDLPQLPDPPPHDV